MRPPPPPAAPVVAPVAPTFAVATFSSAFDNHPAPRRVTWRALCQSLTTFRVVRAEDKRHLPAWSPAEYPDGARRCASAVRAVSCIVLDLDDGSRAAQAQAAWEDWPHIVHTTWSHTPDAPRLRLVVPLEVPVPRALWHRAWHWAHARSGLVADPACKDPSRLYFVPAVRSHDWPRWARVFDPGGPLLRIDAEALPLTPDEQEAARIAAARAMRPPVQVRAGVSDAALRRLRSEALRSDPEARRRAAMALGGRVAGEGSTEAARGVRCPQCGDASVWWPISPVSSPKAMCHHRKSCGWSQWLDLLLDVGAP